MRTTLKKAMSILKEESNIALVWNPNLWTNSRLQLQMLMTLRKVRSTWREWKLSPLEPDWERRRSFSLQLQINTRWEYWDFCASEIITGNLGCCPGRKSVICIWNKAFTVHVQWARLGAREKGFHTDRDGGNKWWRVSPKKWNFY